MSAENSAIAEAVATHPRHRRATWTQGHSPVLRISAGADGYSHRTRQVDCLNSASRRSSAATATCASRYHRPPEGRNTSRNWPMSAARFCWNNPYNASDYSSALRVGRGPLTAGRIFDAQSQADMRPRAAVTERKNIHSTNGPSRKSCLFLGCTREIPNARCHSARIAMAPATSTCATRAISLPQRLHTRRGTAWYSPYDPQAIRSIEA